MIIKQIKDLAFLRLSTSSTYVRAVSSSVRSAPTDFLWTWPRSRSIWIGTHSDTIYGPATPIGIKSALAIIRIDGPSTHQVYRSITRPIIKPKSSSLEQPQNEPPSFALPRSGTVNLRSIICPETQEILDPEAIIINFNHPKNSASTLEFHLHGSPAVVKAVFSALSKLNHLRQAQPGEFTRRRFERAQGSMDVNKILGLKHLIDAETEEQRKWAISEFNSEFNHSYKVMRQQLMRSIALCETMIDFSEDGSIDDRVIWQQVIEQVLKLKSTVTDQLSRSERREKISDGIKVTLYGSPNVGKSTFLNYLVNREAAIVSPYPGTTRDVIELSIDYHGFPIILSDTAGLRSTHNPIEKLGIDRAKEKIQSADIRLFLVSATENEINFKDSEGIQNFQEKNNPTMILITKTDLSNTNKINKLITRLNQRFQNVPVYPISVLDPSKIHQLSHFIEAFKSHLSSLYGFECSPSSSNSFYLTNYQKIQLNEVLKHLNNFLMESNHGAEVKGLKSVDDDHHHQDLHHCDQFDLVTLIEELRLISGLLSKLSFNSSSSDHHLAEISTDEVLGEIFQSFCIGK